jgi:dienelactone hydrolase
MRALHGGAACTAVGAALVGALLLVAGRADARLVEEHVRVPVQVTDAAGKALARDIVVTVFFDDTSPAPRPLLVFNHGRAADAAGRSAVGRARFSAAAAWFAQLGFVVAVPTRIGYGVTGGPDVEDSGTCANKRYEPAYNAAVEQTLQVLAALRARRDVAGDRAVIAGQSFGGMTAILLAGRNPAGVQAFVNFAGGAGGGPKQHPQKPCAPDQIPAMFTHAGTTARLPTLWIYAENDMYFGPRYPRA